MPRTRATVLHAPVNLGLAGGLHYARSHARGRYLAIVQDDVEVDEPWLEPLVETLDRDPTVGAVGSRIALPDGEPYGDGIVMPRKGWHTVVKTAATPDALLAVDACFSASCLVRADAWDSVGGPNPRLYPNQLVDVDFGLRLAEADWSVLMARESVARHLRNASTTSLLRRYLLPHNRRMMERDHRRLLAEHPEHFLDADAVNSWLAHCAAVAEQRRGAPSRSVRLGRRSRSTCSSATRAPTPDGFEWARRSSTCVSRCGSGCAGWSDPSAAPTRDGDARRPFTPLCGSFPPRGGDRSSSTPRVQGGNMICSRCQTENVLQGALAYARTNWSDA